MDKRGRGVPRPHTGHVPTDTLAVFTGHSGSSTNPTRQEHEVNNSQVGAVIPHPNSWWLHRLTMRQCQHKPKWGRPPNYNNWPSIFWRPFFYSSPSWVTMPYRFRRLLLLQFLSVWAFYVALYRLIIPSRQLIQPIAWLYLPIRAFKGPLYTTMGHFFSFGEFGGGLCRLCHA